jgi:hypothetical protein
LRCPLVSDIAGSKSCRIRSITSVALELIAQRRRSVQHLSSLRCARVGEQTQPAVRLQHDVEAVVGVNGRRVSAANHVDQEAIDGQVS